MRIIVTGGNGKLGRAVVAHLKEHGHDVFVQSGAGDGSSLTDDDFVRAGGKIVDDAAAAWGDVDIVVKVKEPIESEYGFLREDLTLFT